MAEENVGQEAKVPVQVSLSGWIALFVFLMIFSGAC